MSERMIRKQVYLGHRQERKLKRLAATRGCSEADLIREAIDRFPDPEGDLLQRLESVGLLAPRPADSEPLTSEELDALDEAYYIWLESQPRSLRLSDVVLEERQSYPW